MHRDLQIYRWSEIHSEPIFLVTQCTPLFAPEKSNQCIVSTPSDCVYDGTATSQVKGTCKQAFCATGYSSIGFLSSDSSPGAYWSFSANCQPTTREVFEMTSSFWKAFPIQMSGFKFTVLRQCPDFSGHAFACHCTSTPIALQFVIASHIRKENLCNCLISTSTLILPLTLLP